MIPSKYEVAINQNLLKRIVKFQIHGEYDAVLSDDYKKFTITPVVTIPDLPITDRILFIDGDRYDESIPNTYIFNEPGKYHIIFDEDIFEVVKED